MNVGNKLEKMSIRGNLDPLERLLEKRIATITNYINRFSVGVEQARKGEMERWI